MAKLGEQDSRWIVSSREDGKNVSNWHWSEKNLTNEMKTRLTELLNGLKLENGKISVTFTEVEKVDGDMTAMNRKGKTRFVYDFNIKLKWKGEIAAEEAVDDKIEASGTLELIDVIVDDTDYQQKITIENDDKTKYPIKQLIQKQANLKVAQILDSLIEQAKDSVNLQQPATVQAVITDDTPVKIVQGSPTPTPQPTTKKEASTSTSKLATKTINQSIVFEVPPQPIYEFLTDEKRISAFTQGPCKFSTISPGGAFEMFGGNVIGVQLCLEPNKKIEQNWRFSSWPSDHYSHLKIEFKAEGGSTRLVLSQTGVPANDYDRTRSGWEEYFWSRIRGICGWNYKIQ
jgi:activator of HSP90 ATPase